MPSDPTWERAVRAEMDQTKRFFGMPDSSDGAVILVAGLSEFAFGMLALLGQWKAVGIIVLVALVRIAVDYPAFRAIGRRARP